MSQWQFVLSHPDINTIFVREAGQAIREAGWRCRAVTGYVDRPEVWWRRLLSLVGRMPEPISIASSAVAC